MWELKLRVHHIHQFFRGAPRMSAGGEIPPLRGRRLAAWSHPTRVRELKFSITHGGQGAGLSHPTRVRELKLVLGSILPQSYLSHPSWGAGVEIPQTRFYKAEVKGAPLMGCGS